MMITIGKYTSLEEAQKDASFLASNGVEVELIYGGDGNIISGTGASIELAVASDEIPRLEYLSGEDNFVEYFNSSSSCPVCGSSDTENRNSIFDFFPLVVNALTGVKSSDDSLIYHCKDCGNRFPVSTSKS